MRSITEKFFQPRNGKLHKHFLIACVGIGLLKIMSVDCFAAVITSPAKKEKEALPPRQVVSKLPDSGQVLAKSGQEEMSSVFSRIGTERCQFRLEGSAKSDARGGVTGFKVVAPKEVSAKSHRQQSGGDGSEVFNDIIHQIFKGALLAILFAWPIMWFGNAGPHGGYKPNVKLRGAALLWRPS